MVDRYSGITVFVLVINSVSILVYSIKKTKVGL